MIRKLLINWAPVTFAIIGLIFLITSFSLRINPVCGANVSPVLTQTPIGNAVVGFLLVVAIPAWVGLVAIGALVGDVLQSNLLALVIAGLSQMLTYFLFGLLIRSLLKKWI